MTGGQPGARRTPSSGSGLSRCRGFTKATVSAWLGALGARGLGSVSIARMITAVRKVAVEAADIGLLAPGCWHRKPGGSHQSREGREKPMGVRVENRLLLRQALLNAPDSMTKKGVPGPGDAGHASVAVCGRSRGRCSYAGRHSAGGITDGASSIGSASMARVRAIPMPILSRSQIRLTGGGMLRSAYRRKRLWCLESALITDFIDGYIPYCICSA